MTSPVISCSAQSDERSISKGNGGSIGIKKKRKCLAKLFHSKEKKASRNDKLRCQRFQTLVTCSPLSQLQKAGFKYGFSRLGHLG